MLSIVGTSFADYSRALEFGCGCGRMLLHMEELARKRELFGVDIDSDAIGWVQRHVPWVKCSVNDGNSAWLLRRHEEGILAWFNVPTDNGASDA
jgi:hypothetical protein